MANKKKKRSSSKKSVRNQNRSGSSLRRPWRLGLLMAGAVGIILAAALFFMESSTTRKMSLTCLDSISMQDLYQKPQDTFADSIEVSDYTLYGTSLVFYDQEYSPLENGSFYGRNAMLKNIQDGSMVTTTFSGAIDSGFDLQTVPEGVYEVYLYDGYTPKRAWMAEPFSVEPIVTMRDHDQVRRIQISASRYYLDKFGVVTENPCLYVAVTQAEPPVQVVDVILDPAPASMEAAGFDETAQSRELCARIQALLEQAGLKTALSDPSGQQGYAGEGSRSAVGYDHQAKIFLSLGMDLQDESRPFCLSSPFSNGRLGNQIVSALKENGVELENIPTMPQLNAGNGYDLILADASLQLSPFSSLPSIRETGGKATQAGEMEGWQANEAYSSSPGMEAAAFFYASWRNPASQSYYLEHQDAIARGIAQGILNYAHIQPDPEASADSDSSNG